ncbi:hypothetical protein BO71DRAFT_480326 [Aspergillus ellipticus CBS 707.79]|uniref:Uncharacterized protein n=1 Tax=Aspergillus ellipticus CBS 707.79 TaxID=1448320 RepID=A0A319E3Y7_9EURO|nr:hypothetical protein BO71DRAFT_480326 [Aspergillus ellipticus CBS 707.79]
MEFSRGFLCTLYSICGEVNYPMCDNVTGRNRPGCEQAADRTGHVGDNAPWVPRQSTEGRGTRMASSAIILTPYPLQEGGQLPWGDGNIDGVPRASGQPGCSVPHVADTQHPLSVTLHQEGFAFAVSHLQSGLATAHRRRGSVQKGAGGEAGGTVYI